jgi:phenylacetate-CoA ligase
LRPKRQEGASPQARLRKKLYFQLHAWAGNPLPRVYEELQSTDEYANPGAVVGPRLSRLLRHCRRSVPYYAPQLAGGDALVDREPFRVLERLPILTKDDIRRNAEALTATGVDRRRCTVVMSGGSTGEPLRLLHDLESLSTQTAEWMRNWEWLGREIGEGMLVIMTNPRDVLHGSVGLKKNLLNAISAERWLLASRLTPDAMRDTLVWLGKRPPRLIVAFPQSAYDLANFAVRNGIEMPPQTAVVSTGGTLYDFIRETVERVFQCEVFDRYGCREVGSVAWECGEHGGLHVFPWSNYVEVVDGDGNPVAPGEEGDVVVTCLTNYAMPLIRYSIGDRAVLAPDEDCVCGRRGRRLSRIVGRGVDAFRARDGTIVHGQYFIYLMYYREWLEKFQIVQRDYDDVLYRIVKARDHVPSEDIEEIGRVTRAALGPDCKVEFEFVDEIGASPSGKFLYVMSDVQARETRPPLPRQPRGAGLSCS